MNNFKMVVPRKEIQLKKQSVGKHGYNNSNSVFGQKGQGSYVRYQLLLAFL